MEHDMSDTLTSQGNAPVRTKLTRQQITGFWGAWLGWTLDGMDSFIYALVLAPALTELLPRSGYPATPGNVGLFGSILFALFLVGWGLSFLWGPWADRYGRRNVLALTILVYGLFTGLSALAQNVYELAAMRLLAGIGIGGEWALAGTYVAEVWPEDRRKMGAGYLQTGYYAGFFLAAGFNYTVGAHFGWRAMFLVGGIPILVAFIVRMNMEEPARWERKQQVIATSRRWALRVIFSGDYLQRTLVMTALLTVAIIGLWAGAVYEPTAVITLAKKAGMVQTQAVKTASLATAILSIGTILGCLTVPVMAERIGRRYTLAFYFAGMATCIALAFGWAFYLPNGLRPFITILFFLGFFGGNFATFSLWLPEQYDTTVRATAFAFATSFGRFIGAGINFAIGAMVRNMGTLGKPVAMTAIAFGIGLLIIPFAYETKGKVLPD
jgi:MFS family permease